MVTTLLLTWLLAAPIQAAPQPAPQPARPRPAARAATTTLAVTVTDSVGAVLEGVTVSLVGSVERQGQTSAEGQLRLLTVPAGTYRVRFAREGFHTFEKELVWRAGQAAPTMTVTLNAAPPPPAPPPPPPPPEPTTPELTLPPPSAPRTLALTDFIERNFIGAREGHKENLVGCSGVGQTILWQVREPWTDRSHPSADAMLYVIGGDGTLKLGTLDVPLAAGSFAVVPRGTSYGSPASRPSRTATCTSGMPSRSASTSAVADRVRRDVQPPLRRHQPDQGRRRVRRGDQGGCPVAGLRLGRPLYYASDYFEQLYDYAVHLIRAARPTSTTQRRPRFASTAAP
jgi:hypothetical protein